MQCQFSLGKVHITVTPRFYQFFLPSFSVSESPTTLKIRTTSGVLKLESEWNAIMTHSVKDVSLVTGDN